MNAADTACTGYRSEAFDDLVHVIDAPAPGTARGVLEGGPEARVGGETRIGGEVGMGRPGKEVVEVADEFGSAHQFPGVNVDADGIAVAELAEGPSGEGLRRGMSETGSGGNSREAPVGEDRQVLAHRGITQGGGDLVGLRHAGPEGTQSGQDEHFALLHPVTIRRFQGRDGGFLGDEDAGRSLVDKDAVLV